MAQDPRHFLISSDYQIPAVVAKWQGSINVAAYDWKDTTIAHNLPFTPLIVGQWSLNSNFSPAYDISTQNGYFVGVSFNQVVGSNSSDLVFRLDNGHSTQKTFYYRLLAFSPQDYSGDVPYVDDNSDFKLNSDILQPKIFKYGSANLTGGNYSVTHNLGYLPQVRVWVYDSVNNVTAPVVNSHYEDGSNTFGVGIDTSKMTLYGGLSGDKIYYHIYADEV